MKKTSKQKKLAKQALKLEVRAMRKEIMSQRNDNSVVTNDEVVQQIVGKETGTNGKDWKRGKLECRDCGSVNYVWEHTDGKSAYCVMCQIEFMLEDDAPCFSTVSNDKLETSKKWDAQAWKHRTPDDWSWKNTSGATTGFVNASCTHPPTKYIWGENWSVSVGKKFDCTQHCQDFDIVMNLTYTSVRDPHVIPIPELQKWETYRTFKEMQMNWPDYGVVNLPIQFWLDLLNYIKTNNQRMLIFCLGGHGRTGTALAALLICEFGYTPIKACKHVRTRYCDEAIESLSQEQYLNSLYKQLRAKVEAGEIPEPIAPNEPEIIQHETSEAGECVNEAVEEYIPASKPLVHDPKQLPLIDVSTLCMACGRPWKECQENECILSNTAIAKGADC